MRRRRTDWRWWVERERSYIPRRGLGLWYEAGSTGTTYGEPGRNMHLVVCAVLLLWTFVLRVTWKDHGDG